MSDAAQTLTPGQRLKAERERRGMSTQKAADEMHLDSWVIEALEADDYQRIGPPVYAKGHLKKYASILGLPAAEILSAFSADAPPAVARAAAPSSVRMPTAAPAGTDLPWPQLAAALIALLLGGLFWWHPWHQRSAAPVPPSRAASSSQTDGASVAETQPERAAESPGEDTNSPALAPGVGARAAARADDAPGAAVSSTTAAPGAPAPATAGGVPPTAAGTPAAVPAVQSKSAAASEADAARGAGRARLRLSFSADSWVDVRDAEGRRVYAGSGRANSVKTIAGIAPLRVYLGFASGVQLQLNDRAVAIGPQFVTGDVARFEAGADGVLRRDTHAAPPSSVPANGVAAHAAPPRG
jgi:cytoskeleton protein RodZ